MRIHGLVLVAFLTAVAGCTPKDKALVTVLGAGATFPAPLIKEWIADFGKDHETLRISYQSMGSKTGLELLKESKADFAVSDVAPKDEQVKDVSGGVHVFPVAAGSVAVCYHLPGVAGEVKLSRAVLAGIFLGEVTTWDDKKIADDNTTLKLPKDTPIVIVHRSGASGTTYVFTQYLSAVSSAWKKEKGAGYTVAWPKNSQRAMGNDGVVELIKEKPGAIGYLSFSAGEENKLAMAALENKSGDFVKPTPASGKAALTPVTTLDKLREWVPDAEGKEAYPIVTFTWVVVRKQLADKNAAGQLKDFLKYALTKGQEKSEPRGYLPLPAHVVDKVLPEVERIGS